MFISVFFFFVHRNEDHLACDVLPVPTLSKGIFPTRIVSLRGRLEATVARSRTGGVRRPCPVSYFLVRSLVSALVTGFRVSLGTRTACSVSFVYCLLAKSTLATEAIWAMVT